MKKTYFLSIVLALVVSLTFGAPAYAAEMAQTSVDEPSGRPHRILGKIISVDASALTLVLKPQRGPELTLTADEDTRYTGAAESLEEIEPGMQAAVVVRREAGGIVRLTRIITRIPLEGYRGQVTAVDSNAGTLTLMTRQGETLTFSVGESTRYKGYQTTVESLADIQPGMWAAIRASQVDNGGLLAHFILAASPENLPRFDVRMGGKVISVGETSFTIENRKGEEITFQVDENTRFRSRDGNVTKLNQLKEGMLVAVGGQELDDGSFLAKGVLVLQRKR